MNLLFQKIHARSYGAACTPHEIRMNLSGPFIFLKSPFNFPRGKCAQRLGFCKRARVVERRGGPGLARSFAKSSQLVGRVVQHEERAD